MRSVDREETFGAACGGNIFMKKLLVVAAMVCMAHGTAAFAQAPSLGNYTSTDIGGTLLTGRFSESWVGAGGHGQIGNTVNIESWDKKSLGGQWKLWCATLAAPPQVIEDSVDEKGNGYRVWMASYVGGYLWLSESGPWNGGSANGYTGVVDTYTSYLRIRYEKDVAAEITCEISATGHLQEHPEICFTFDASCRIYGDTAKDKKIGDNFPPFLDLNCKTVPDEGWWGFVREIHITLTGCVTPVQERTWGAIKSLYGN